MKYSAITIREAGLHVYWTRCNGVHILRARIPNGKWYYIDSQVWNHAQEYGIMEAFKDHMILGDYLTVKV